MDRVRYEEYIQSDKWRERSDQAKERAFQACLLCNVGRKYKELHAHHLTYERLGDEPLEDLFVVCRDCHEMLHDSNVKPGIALLTDLPNALRRWGIPAYGNMLYKCDDQWTYYEQGKSLIRAGAAWFGEGNNGVKDGNQDWYGRAVRILCYYLFVPHGSDHCQACRDNSSKGSSDG